MRRGSRKDQNHDVIAELFEKAGFFVHDTSSSGNGMPDLTLAYRGVVKLVEVKNPRTAYGKRGLNKRQKKLIEERGFPVSVIASVDQALEFIARIKACRTEHEMSSVIFRNGAFLTEAELDRWHPMPKGKTA